jgi:hypothetical protein
MKKFLGTMLVFAMAIFAIACGGSTTNTNTTNANANKPVTNVNPSPAATAPPVNSTVNPTMPANGAKPTNGNQSVVSPQGKTVDQKTKEKEEAIKSSTVPAPPAAASPKKP